MHTSSCCALPDSYYCTFPAYYCTLPLLVIAHFLLHIIAHFLFLSHFLLITAHYQCSTQWWQKWPPCTFHLLLLLHFLLLLLHFLLLLLHFFLLLVHSSYYYTPPISTFLLLSLHSPLLCRHIYWSCKSEPKIFRTRMDGTQSQHELFRQHPMRTSRIFALSFNFSEVGNAELFWAINVSERWVEFVVPPSLSQRERERERERDHIFYLFIYIIFLYSPSTSYRILRTSVLNTDVSSYSVALNGYTSQILDLQMANNGAIFIDAL